MISSAIWDKSARVNFQRLTKLLEPVGRVQFVVFEKFTSADFSQIAREKSCDYFLIIHIQKFLCKCMTNKTCSVAYLSESLSKHYGVARLWKSRYCYGILKLPVMHALSGAFIIIQLHHSWYELKCATSIQAYNLPSLRAVAKENPRLVTFSSFVEPLLCCTNVQLLVHWFIHW